MSKKESISVRMTKEEREKFNSLSDEERAAYMKDLVMKKQKTTFLAAVLAQLTLENIDDLEYFGLNRDKVKITVRTLKNQMNKFMNDIYGGNGISPEHTDVMTKISKDIEDLIDDHYDKIEEV